MSTITEGVAVQVFASGAVRGTDASGERYDLMSRLALVEVGQWATTVARKRFDMPGDEGFTFAPEDCARQAVGDALAYLESDHDDRALVRSAAYWMLLASHLDREGSIEFVGVLPPRGVRAYAEALAEGVAKGYVVDSWRKGFPIRDLLNHAIRHEVFWRDGDGTEDHLGHAAWNLLTAVDLLVTVPAMAEGLRWYAAEDADDLASRMPLDDAVAAGMIARTPDGRRVVTFAQAMTVQVHDEWDCDYASSSWEEPIADPVVREWHLASPCYNEYHNVRRDMVGCFQVVSVGADGRIHCDLAHVFHDDDKFKIPIVDNEGRLRLKPPGWSIGLDADGNPQFYASRIMPAEAEDLAGAMRVIESVGLGSMFNAGSKFPYFGRLKSSPVDPTGIMAELPHAMNSWSSNYGMTTTPGKIIPADSSGVACGPEVAASEGGKSSTPATDHDDIGIPDKLIWRDDHGRRMVANDAVLSEVAQVPEGWTLAKVGKRQWWVEPAGGPGVDPAKAWHWTGSSVRARLGDGHGPVDLPTFRDSTAECDVMRRVTTWGEEVIRPEGWYLSTDRLIGDVFIRCDPIPEAG